MIDILMLIKAGVTLSRKNKRPSFADNLAYFFNYQINHMYIRYFMWNFAGKQNDIQSHGSITEGQWLSGISFRRMAIRPTN